MPDVLGLIPARGGSKGVPRKNIRLLAGAPLIAWTIQAAQQCSGLNRLIVSTDDEEIAAISRSLGAEVPFLRPAALAADATPDLPVYRHSLAWLADHDGYRPEFVAWLRPTAPLRTAADIDGAIAQLAASSAACLRSVTAAAHHPYWMKYLHDGRLSPFLEGFDEFTYYRRQLLPGVYYLNGAVDVVRCVAVPPDGPLFGPDMLGFDLPPERSLDIDSEMDLAVAELLLARRSSDPTHPDR